MRVGIVAYELEGRPTGVGRVLAGLLGGAVAAAPDARFVLFLRGAPRPHPLFEHGAVEPVFAGSRRRPVWWEQVELPRALRRHRLDVVYSPAYSLPPRLLAPAVVTMHDLSFELLPREFGWRERTRRRLLARQACRRAARVVASLPHVADELVRRYRVPRSKLRAIDWGVDPRFVPLSAPPEVAAAESIVLHVGSVLERRNLPLVLDALAAVRRGPLPALRLVLVGDDRLRDRSLLRDAIARRGLEQAVEVAGYASEAELLSWYRRAAALISISSYEGWGLPPLEALACGVPVVVSGGQALDQLWPDYPLRCPRPDEETVARALVRAVAPSPERERLRAEGVARMAALTWERAAGQWLEVLAEARVEAGA